MPVPSNATQRIYNIQFNVLISQHVSTVFRSSSDEYNCLPNQPFARPLPTHRTAQRQNKRTQTSMLEAGLEPTSPMFERANALDRAATVIGTPALSHMS
jgi:hypothetical protein